MNFPHKLKRGIIVKNINNIIIDVKFEDNTIAPAFCSENDRLKKLYIIGSEVWVSLTPEQCKIKYEATLLNKGEGLIMINNKYIPQIFNDAFESGKLTKFKEYDTIKDLSKDSNGLIHFELSNKKGKKCYIHTTNIHNKIDANITFPSTLDFRKIAVYSRLKELRSENVDTFVILIITRVDFLGIRFNWSIDPIAAARIFEESKSGLKLLSYGCNLDKNDIEICQEIDIIY